MISLFEQAKDGSTKTTKKKPVRVCIIIAECTLTVWLSCRLKVKEMKEEAALSMKNNQVCLQQQGGFSTTMK